ncbi:MAG TPA: hypothetical protein VMR21_05415 [Vicinamibacteria bacterium]|nr:hypothetical protein [Vicinamibacteria bacterium]
MRSGAAPLALAVLLGGIVPREARAADPPGHSGALGPYPMDREASGTSWQPDAAGMDGLHLWAGSWRLMVHAAAAGAFTRQGGPRGGDQAFSTSMAMAAASRRLGEGLFTVRAMTSLEPLMGPEGYRLLLQTGETADGRRPLIDRQHPHDLAMELAVVYSRPLGPRGSAFAYAGWPGEPALGPPAFMHRASASPAAIAPLSHHWLDATHISFGTATAGLVWGAAKVEVSAFNGHEPDQARWGLDRPRFDSRSARLSLNPRSWLSAQVSAALLREPEQLHPGIDVRRYTASVSMAGDWGGTRPAATVAWGRNVRSADLPTSCPIASREQALAHACAALPPYGPSRVLDALLAEGTLRAGNRHTVSLRAEWVEKDELFPAADPFHVRVFPVASVQAGYRYLLPIAGRVGWGVGALGAVSVVPEFLATDYGRRPLSYWIVVDARLR